MSSADFLQQMAISSRERLRAARELRDEGALLAAAQHCAAAPMLRLDPQFDLIAELKLRSPAAGALGRANESVVQRVLAYARGGAAAVSVLTEPTRFDGSLDHLQAAAAALRPLQIPTMRKDFLLDPYQVIEARHAGAGGVLLIARMLSRSQIKALLDCASSLGLFVLLEIFDAQDLEHAHAAVGSHLGRASRSASHSARGSASGSASAAADVATAPPLLVGVNCRDLTSLQIVPQRLLDLLGQLPEGVPHVAESGVLTPSDAARVAAAGYRLALVGSALMQGEPAELVGSMVSAGREAACRARLRGRQAN